MSNSPALSDSQKWLIVVLFTGFCWLLYQLSPILTPFIAATLLAYLGDPIVDKLEEYKLPRWGAVSVVFLGLFLFVIGLWFILLPQINLQIHLLIEKSPQYLLWLRESIFPWIEKFAGFNPDISSPKELKDILNRWDNSQSMIHWILGSVSQSGLAILGLITNIGLIPIITFYLLRDWDHLVLKIHQIIPRRYEPTVVKLAKESDEVLSDWLRGQLIVMFALAMIYSIGLKLIDIEFALLIGTFAGLVSFVPYLGLILGIIIAGIASILQTQGLGLLFPVCVVFIIGQALEGSILTPKLVGEKIGLHPVAVIFAIMAGGQLYGFFGVLLALPVSAVILVILRYFYQKYNCSTLYNDC